jgi:hypothetical protein
VGTEGKYCVPENEDEEIVGAKCIDTEHGGAECSLNNDKTDCEVVGGDCTYFPAKTCHEIIYGTNRGVSWAGHERSSRCTRDEDCTADPSQGGLYQGGMVCTPDNPEDIHSLRSCGVTLDGKQWHAIRDILGSHSIEELRRLTRWWLRGNLSGAEWENQNADNSNRDNRLNINSLGIRGKKLINDPVSGVWVKPDGILWEYMDEDARDSMRASRMHDARAMNSGEQEWGTEMTETQLSEEKKALIRYLLTKYTRILHPSLDNKTTACRDAPLPENGYDPHVGECPEYSPTGPSCQTCQGMIDNHLAKCLLDDRAVITADSS